MMYVPDRTPLDYEGIAEVESRREVDLLKARIERLREVIHWYDDAYREKYDVPPFSDAEIEEFMDDTLHPGDMGPPSRTT